MRNKYNYRYKRGGRILPKFAEGGGGIMGSIGGMMGGGGGMP
jgi:hypothetical protein